MASTVFGAVRGGAPELSRLTGIDNTVRTLRDCEYIDDARVESIDLGAGSVRCRVDLNHSLLYKILGEATGLDIANEEDLLPQMVELARTREKYDKIAGAHRGHGGGGRQRKIRFAVEGYVRVT